MTDHKMNAVDWIARVLVIIGSLLFIIIVFRPLLIGLLLRSIITKLVFMLIFVSGIWEIVRLIRKK